MEFQRIALFIALFMVGLMLFHAWQTDHAVLTPVSKPIATLQQQSQENKSNTNPAQSVTPETVSNEPSKDIPVATNLEPVPQERTIQIKTDVLDVTVDTLGGDIIRSALPQYSKSIQAPNTPEVLLNNDPATVYIAKSALVSSLRPDVNTAKAQFVSAQKQYVLDNKDNLQVNLEWKKDGITVTKTYTFNRGSYLILVSYNIANHGNENWIGSLYTQLTRKNAPPEGNSFFAIHPYFGAAISSPEKKYEEISFSQMEKKPLERTIQGGFAAMVQHYFLGAWIPDNKQTYQYYAVPDGNNIFTVGMRGSNINVAPGKSTNLDSKLYIGPEIADVLKKIAPGLELTVSYGWLWFLSDIIFWVMNEIYKIVGNWGWSIVLVTVLIKLLFYHLSAKSYSSMAKMRKLQPKMESLRERYKDDKQKLGQATMELYKSEGVNPLGGCLPILVQIPVFFALYMVLLESVEFRQAPWILWLQDLATPDPYYVLPVLMGLTMFVQQKLSPAPPDPMQAKVMLFMPVVFTVLFLNFPSGLVLYWVVNNALSILQQWYVTYEFERKEALKRST